jgi:hypothetical protein
VRVDAGDDKLVFTYPTPSLPSPKVPALVETR